jgi:hypothetical protein
MSDVSQAHQRSSRLKSRLSSSYYNVYTKWDGERFDKARICEPLVAIWSVSVILPDQVLGLQSMRVVL